MPVPRLADGHVDLNGVWTGGGPVNDLEKDGGLKPGDIDNLMLPWAKEVMSKRDVTMEPHNQCLPMGVPRVTPFPYRFVQNYTHKAATHLFILHEGNIHTYRQIFMDGRKHPAELDPTWLGHSIGSMGGRHAGDRYRRLQRQVLVRSARVIRTPSSSTRSSGGRGRTWVTWRTSSPSKTRARTRSRSR